ncbi:MAG: response regulator [Promethearchaeota archaeon]
MIAEDRRLFREGLRLILSRAKDIKIVGEAANGPQTINVVKDLKPDIVLIDITMIDMDGLEVIQPITQESPKTKALIISVSMDENLIFKALKVGAKGCLSKDADISDLVKAIKAVYKGELWLERKLIARYFEKGANYDIKNVDRDKGVLKEDLSPREQEVLSYLTKGMTNKEIAEVLFISDKTVKCHLNSIFKKLNVTRRLQAILYAIHHGLG